LSCLGIIQELNLNKISHPPNQLRLKLDNLDELALSIKEHGLLQPIIVRPVERKYEVVAGNRRFQAVKKLGVKKVAPSHCSGDSFRELSKREYKKNYIEGGVGQIISF